MYSKSLQGTYLTGEDVRNHKPKDIRTARKNAAKLAEQENNTIAYLAENLGLDKAIKSLCKEFGYSFEEAKKAVEDYIRRSN